MQSAHEIESTRLLRRDGGRDRVNAGHMYPLTEVKSEQPGEILCESRKIENNQKCLSASRS